MEKIRTYIEQRKEKPKPPKGGVNSVFNAAVARFLEDIGDKGHPFGYWCGRLRGVPPQRIHEWISSSKKAKKPIALFQHLLKGYREEKKSYPHRSPDTT